MIILYREIMNDFKIIKELYYKLKEKEKLGIEFCLLFVYNSEKTIRDEVHISECVLKTEKDMIMNSFREIFNYVYAIDGEQIFLDRILELKSKHKNIYVYSMAQNIDGIGRRCLIPLLCDYYELINISADFLSSSLSDNKTLMFKLIENQLKKYIPKSFYIHDNRDIISIVSELKNRKWVIKPNDESASIGVEIMDFKSYSIDMIIDYLKNYKKRFDIFFIQEFIDGKEVAVPLLYYNSEYYCPGISEVIFLGEKNYLDYNTVQLENYCFKEYDSDLKEELIEVAEAIAKTLNFQAISRIDFRIRNSNIYVEDIGSNPTISEENGVNILFREKLNASSSCIYELLANIKLNETIHTTSL